jgi:hypothetical protein
MQLSSLYNIPLRQIDRFLIGSLGRIHSGFIEESVPGYESRFNYEPGKVLIDKIEQYTFLHKDEDLTLGEKVGAIIKKEWDSLSTLIDTFKYIDLESGIRVEADDKRKENLIPLVKLELQKLEPLVKDLKMLLLHRDSPYYTHITFLNKAFY